MKFEVRLIALMRLYTITAKTNYIFYKFVGADVDFVAFNHKLESGPFTKTKYVFIKYTLKAN